MNIPEYKIEEWLEVLEPFQQELIQTLLVEHSEEEAIQIWISVSGPEYTTSFGGTEKKDYLKSFKEEFDKFILCDDKYKNDIKELNEYTTITKYFIVSFISSVLAKSLGVVSGVVAPLIVLILGVIGKIGLNAYRNAVLKEREKLDQK